MEIGMYSQNNLRFIDVSKLHRKLGDTLCRTLPGYHAFMGCDYKAAFCRKGKVRPFKILENNLKCQEVCVWGIRCKYVCAIYGRKRIASVDEGRLELFLKKYKPKESKLISSMKKFDGSQLLPCSRVLKEKNQMYNWGLAFISISITTRSIASWLWVDYTAPNISGQMVRWATIASIYWCNSGGKRVWSRKCWQRLGYHILNFIKLYVNKIGEKIFLWKVTKFQKLVNCVTYTRRKFLPAWNFVTLPRRFKCCIH